MKIKGIRTVLILFMALCLAGCGKEPKASEETPLASSQELSTTEQEGHGKDSNEDTAGDGEEHGTSETSGKDSPGTGEDSDAENPADSEALFGGGILTGTVMEASEKECRVNAAREDGDELVVSVVDDAGNTEDQERIVYRENCVFQSVSIHTGTHEVKYASSDSGSVKKGDSLIVYGAYGDDGVLYEIGRASCRERV